MWNHGSLSARTLYSIFILPVYIFICLGFCLQIFLLLLFAIVSSYRRRLLIISYEWSASWKKHHGRWEGCGRRNRRQFRLKKFWWTKTDTRRCERCADSSSTTRKLRFPGVARRMVRSVVHCQDGVWWHKSDGVQPKSKSSWHCGSCSRWTIEGFKSVLCRYIFWVLAKRYTFHLSPWQS